MPLLSDAKKIMVGGTGISKVYAGSELVWPKVDPLPTQIKTASGGPFQGQYVTWEYELYDCVTLGTDWSVRYGYEGSPGSITWQPWASLVSFDTIYWFYSPDHKRLAWTTLLTLSNEWNGLSLLTWYQARDNRTGQTIINEKFDPAAPSVTRPSNAFDCTSGGLPIASNITTDVPGDPQRRVWVTWDNALNQNCTDLRAYDVRMGYSDSVNGSTEPSYWYPPKRLSEQDNVMIWPTNNAILWSPDEATTDNSMLKRLWYWVHLYADESSTIVPKAKIDSIPPVYPYPSGDGITC